MGKPPTFPPAGISGLTSLPGDNAAWEQTRSEEKSSNRLSPDPEAPP
jgi:hypothetical protein